jgi:iron complex outermembrane receptor protein
MSLLWGSTLYAQDQSDQGSEEETTLEEVIVTGSIIRRPETATASPVSVLTDQDMDVRGINTIADAVTLLPANNAGTMNSSWSSYGFAKGASAVSLRGLTVSSSLVIFDGLRMAPYPLGDDGRRNFVDLGTMPDSIVDRIEILKDGASSTYGADAVAGVVNVITKKEITGLHFNGSYGISQEGDGDEYRADLTAGFGELDVDGYNFYANFEVQHSDAISALDRGYPWNTQDYGQFCNEDGVCIANRNVNGLNYDGTVAGISGTGTRVPYTRPWDPATGTALGPWRLLNPEAGCRDLIEVNPSNAAALSLQGPICEENFYFDFVNVYPTIDRNSVNARYTMRLGDNHEFYAMFSYYNTETRDSGGTQDYVGRTTPPGGPDVETVGIYPLILPVYVCPIGTATCDASNGVLNPNNPFAADGLNARVAYRWPFPRQSDQDTDAFRYAAGITGSFGRDGLWDYNVEAVSGSIELTDARTGYIVPRHMLNVIADGSFNFVDPSQNPQAIWDYIDPGYTTVSTSDVDQIQGTLARPLFELPGGSMVAAVGLSYRREAVNSPNANPALPDPYMRAQSLNTVSVTGSRRVKSAFCELDMPVLESLNVNLAGRWDDYSTGQNNFAPKLGLMFYPIEWLTLRGTYSEGFRIPSFNEAFGNPTTGYITLSADCNSPTYAAFCEAHNYNAYATQSFGVGLTASGNPELNPEESTSYTVGFVLEPSNNLSLTVDYWHIKIDDLISNADYSPALTQWYSNNGVVDAPGIDGALPGVPDLDYPNALPHLGFVLYSYQNADQQVAEGIDLGVNFTWDFGNVFFRSQLETAYLMELSKTINGVKENYEGTLSPCDVTSCSGAPDWRATWTNGIEWNDWTFALTMNYTGSYSNASVDYGGDPGDCEANVGISVWFYDDGSPFKCTHSAYIDWDFTASWQLTESIQLYANILNLLDEEPNFDPASTYHLYGFNPAWELSGWRGRYFRAGIRLDF